MTWPQRIALLVFVVAGVWALLDIVWRLAWRDRPDPTPKAEPAPAIPRPRARHRAGDPRTTEFSAAAVLAERDRLADEAQARQRAAVGRETGR